MVPPFHASHSSRLRRVVRRLFSCALVLVLLAPCAEARQSKQAIYAGYRTLSSSLPAQRLMLHMGVWYPTRRKAGTVTEGDWSFRAARNAPVLQGPWPVIILSHDVTGSAWTHHDIAGALAARGFIVAAPTHDHDNGEDMALLFSDRELPVRALQLRAALDLVLEHPQIGAQADRSRIGFLGFGMPSSAGLLLAGGEMTPDAWPSFCPQRQTGQLDFSPREAFGRIGERGCDGGNAVVLGEKTDGATGQGVGFVQYHGNTKQTCGNNGRETSVTAGGEEHIGTEAFKEGATTKGGRKVTWVGDGACARTEKRALPRLGGLALRGTGPGEDEGEFMTFGTKAFGDGEGGIDVATGAAAGDGDTFGVWHGQRSMQSMSCRARAWAFTLSRRSRTHFQRQEMEPFSSMGRSRKSPSKPARRSR